MARDALVAERAAALARAPMRWPSATAELQRQVRRTPDQAEEALRGREMMFRGLADAMPQIVFVIYGDGTGEFINRRWHEYTGDQRRPSPRRRAGNRLVHPDDVGRLRLRWQQAMRPARRSWRSSGCAARTSQYPLVPGASGAGGRTVRWRCRHWVGTLTDIDDIHRADTALLESE